MSQNHEQTHCKSCGRYIGALELCPYCRTFNPKRLVVKLIKYLSPVISVLGLFVLYYIGLHYGNPEVKLDQLSKRSNFAQVKVNAEVSAVPRYYAAQGKGENAGGSFEFEIDDGTMAMLARCYDDATGELVRAKKIPALGDKVTVRGSFQYKGKGGFIIIGSDNGLEINRVMPEKATALKIMAQKEIDKTGLKPHERVKISGKISEIKSSRYEFALKLDDMAGNIVTAVIPISALQISGQVKEDVSEFKFNYKEGDFVTLSGALEKRGRRGYEYFAVIVPAPEDILKSSEENVKKDNQ